jgi:hypothetical protein
MVLERFQSISRQDRQTGTQNASSFPQWQQGKPDETISPGGPKQVLKAEDPCFGTNLCLTQSEGVLPWTRENFSGSARSY